MSTGMPPEESVVGSKVDYVRNQLRREIIAGEVQPGTPLRQDDLAARLNVSPTPVREALRRLEAEGLVVYRANHGATVADLPGNAVKELYLFRAELEGLLCELAAQVISDEALVDLRRMQLEMESGLGVWNSEQLATASREFHGFIARIGGPAFLASHLRWIWSNYEVPSGISLWKNLSAAREFVAIHARLLAALEARDGATARQIMTDHVHVAGMMRGA